MIKVINASAAVTLLERRPEKISGSERDSNPRPLRCQFFQVSGDVYWNRRRLLEQGTIIEIGDAYWNRGRLLKQRTLIGIGDAYWNDGRLLE